MSFFSRESSIEKGKPVSLYEFNRGATEWLYTSADRDIVYGGKTYKALAISDGGIVQSGSATTDDVKITLPPTASVLAQYFGTPPSDTVYAAIRRKHDGDNDAPIHWVGQVQAVGARKTSEATITCTTLGATFKRDGLRLAWSRNCPHMLYDLNCKVDRMAYRIGADVEIVTAHTVKAEALTSRPNNYFDGGYIEWTKAGIVERRPLQVHVGNLITLLGFADGLDVGQHFYVYPGCPRTIQACNDKFNNMLNYGGFPAMPGSSPFDGNPVF